jgi:hypothetical protein
MGETAELADFDEMLYKVEGSGENGEGDYYLIATAEQPISTMYRGEWLERNKLPLKYGGISPCFRKEAGAHGKDTWGIFRIHQFEKVEQFVICAPEESWKYHEEMIKVSQEFYESLGLPYRVINIVSGALNNAAAKKYDLEAWFPGYNTYRELVSCSNCTDYQSRSAEIRLRTDKKVEGDKKVYVHMLNGTLCATERALCCILENYQTEKGLNVPEVLRPYVGVDFIPYKEELLPKKESKGDDKKKKKGKDKDDGKKEKGKKNEKNEKGLTKSIGVSNYNVQNILNILSICKIKPAANEVEFHPYLFQKDLKEFCEKEGIVVIGYNPMVKGAYCKEREEYIKERKLHFDLFNEEIVVNLAKKYGKTVGQIILNWHLHTGDIPIPSSSNPNRMKENLGAADFKMDENDYKEMNSFEEKGKQLRFCSGFGIYGIDIFA